MSLSVKESKRSEAVDGFLVRAAHAIARGIRKLANAMGEGYLQELDRRAIEADAFLKRSVSRY